MDEKKPEQKSSIRKYLLGLGAAFALGLGIGTHYSQDIKYLFWRSEKAAIDVDQALEKRSPKIVLDYDKAMRGALYGWTEEDIQEKRSKFISELDAKIKKYEQKNEQGAK